eukprot:PITA_21697
MVAHFADSVMAEEQVEPDEEKEEVVTTDEAPRIGHAVNMISLNPKKSIFVVFKGNLLGHIIAKSGIKVNPDKVRTTTQIPDLVNKKSMQSFLGQVNFLREFISNYAQIVKPIQEMIEKEEVYKWNKREKDMFSHIKQAIVEPPDFSKVFLLYTFSSDTSLVVKLT